MRAKGYPMAQEIVNGDDVLEVRDVVRRAAKRARAESLPILVEAKTYRFRGHSMSDPAKYRTKEEVEEWKARCPVTNFTALLRGGGALSEADLEAVEDAVAREIEEAVAFAEAGEWEPVEDL